MATTNIEWATDVWNPTTGCDRISPGCDNCYALTMARRLKGMGQAKYQNDGDPRTSGPGFGVTVHPDMLRLPYRWRTPRRVFVNSMSDLFHAKVPLDFIRAVFEVIADTPQHTYLVLTKRAARLRKLADQLDWPPNLWMGVSAEDQERADQRIPALLATPAVVHWVSAEPLLGPLDLRPYLAGGLSWVVVGGESGPGARPMHPDWARTIRDQCVDAGVAFFFKQWGAWEPTGALGIGHPRSGRIYVGPPVDSSGFREEMARVSRRAGGRLLDGRTWDEYPRPLAEVAS